MPVKKKTIERMYFTIGEVAKMFNVQTSLIRFWEKEFSIIKPSKNRKGNRMFTQKDVDNFHLIYHLVKERGYTLKGAKEKLKQKNELVENELEIVKSLKKIKEYLIEMKDNMD